MSDTKLLKEMGRRVFAQRKLLKMTQEELAEEIGVSTQMISNLETGKKAVRPENLLKLCEALHISADYVLTGNPYTHAADSLMGELANLTPDELGMVKEIINYCAYKRAQNKATQITK